MTCREETIRRIHEAILADAPNSDDRRREAEDALFLTAAAILTKRLGVPASSELIERMAGDARLAMIDAVES